MERIGKKQRLAIDVPSEIRDQLLNGSRHQELDECARFGGLDGGVLLRVDGIHVVDVPKVWIPLEQNRETKAPAQSHTIGMRFDSVIP